MIVRIGEYDFRDSNTSFPHVDVRISERIIHQKFNFLTFENDLALLRLAEPVKLAPHIIPVCLAPYKNYTGSYGKVHIKTTLFQVQQKLRSMLITGTITGWGRLSQGLFKFFFGYCTALPFLFCIQGVLYHQPFIKYRCLLLVRRTVNSGLMTEIGTKILNPVLSAPDIKMEVGMPAR